MSHKFRINRPCDEKIEFYIDDRIVGGADHDGEGWGGMAAMERLFTEIAHQLDAELEETNEDEE